MCHSISVPIVYNWLVKGAFNEDDNETDSHRQHERQKMYPCEIDLPGTDVEVHEIIYNLALEKSLNVVDYNLFSHIDQLDKALA